MLRTSFGRSMLGTTALAWLSVIITCLAAPAYASYLAVAALSGVCVGIVNRFNCRSGTLLLAIVSITLTVLPQSVVRFIFASNLADTWLVYVQYFSVHFAISIPVMLVLLFVTKRDEPKPPNPALQPTTTRAYARAVVAELFR